MKECPLSSMEFPTGEAFREMFQAHTVLLTQTLSIAGPMSLKIAIELGIPDAMQTHGRPVSLSELARSIPIPPSRDPMLQRLMRLLVSRGVFSAHGEADGDGEPAYSLTPFSKLLLTKGTNMAAYVLNPLEPEFFSVWYSTAAWFKSEGTFSSPFEVAHGGRSLWELVNERPELNGLFNEAMASSARWVMKAVVAECPEVFSGIRTLVDVGGGTGTTARTIAEAFPGLKCTVYDLPHVVATMPASTEVSAIGGDMFEYIPPADAILFKSILHNWNDEDCMKILKRCKDAILAREEGGKVIIVDMVVNSCMDNPMITEAHLSYDVSMMVAFRGKEREEHEWMKIFYDAGFKDYKMSPIGVHSIIELYP